MFDFLEPFPAAQIAFEPKPAGALADRVRRDPSDLLRLALPDLA